jgi:para-aminobenzoate synthetase / 4-amino-4-deoxychorismate lyase
MVADYAPGNIGPMNVHCEIDWPGGNEPLRLAFSEPSELLTAWRREEVRGVLERVETLAAGGCWVTGFVAYEAASAFDAALTGHAPREGLPLAMFVAFRSPSATRPRGEFMPGCWRDATSEAGFEAAVASIRADIADGRFYQVNYTTRLRTPFFGDAAALFDALRAAQPGAHSLYLDFGRRQVCSVSPELFFHWHKEAGLPRRLTLRPMKGTAPREAVAEVDRRAADALRDSAKDRAENLMIVDLLRNDASRIARLGSVVVPRLFDVEPWVTVWQMTSTVECETRPDTGLADVFAALFPCGSVTGAPKAEAMKAIRELEPGPRGVYCGAVGIVMPGGEARFNVGIRTVVVDTEQGIAECGIGSGIVIDSTVSGEAEEWRMKQRFLRRACPEYELLETLLWRHRDHGRYWLRKEHVARLEASARALGFEWNREVVEAALDDAARTFGAGPWRVRLRLAMDGTVAVDGVPMDATRGPVVCAVARAPIDSRNPWLRHKTTWRGFYEALEVQGGFDTLLFNEQGEATEFTRGNLVVRLGGKLLTPAFACGLLPGTFRAALLARGAISEATIHLEDLAKAEAVWFVNSVRGALRATM